MSDRIDRRSFLARGAATGVGIAAIGAGGGILDACSSGSGSSSTTGTGGHPDGITTATPKKGGQLIFGTEAEEKGFSTTQGTFDTTGILYARTVFDPLAIIDINGNVQPYLAQSITPNTDYTVWTITMRPNLVFHNGAPCDGAAVAENFALQQASAPDRPGVHHHRQRLGAQLAGGHRHHEVALGAVRLLPGRRDRWPDRLHRRAHLAQVGQPDQPDRHRSLRLPDLGTRTATSPPPPTRTTGGPATPISTASPTGLSPTRSSCWPPSCRAGWTSSTTRRPPVTGQLRADSSLGYTDDSQHVAGEPDMNFLLLNLSKPPFDNLKVRQAAAMAVSSAEYAKVIDQGISPTSNGPFASGSPYFAPTGYPEPNPTKAKQLVSEVHQETGQPVVVTIDHVPDPATARIAEYLQQQFESAGMQVTLATIQQAQAIGTALAGSFESIVWQQFGAVNPDLNYIFWSPTNAVQTLCRQHGPEHRPEDGGRPAQGPAVTSPCRSDSRLPGSGPVDGFGHPLYLDRSHRLVDRGPAQGAELEQPDHPGGQAGVRHDHRRHLAHPDLAESLSRATGSRRGSSDQPARSLTRVGAKSG